MSYFIGFTRYALPVLALVILAKCMMTLLFGHPVNKTYGYIIDRNNGEKTPLNMWETSIGRSNSCDITIAYDTVSRFQAVISRRPDGWYIYDTMSRSGTGVNGEKVEKRAVIKHGDALTFGNMSFTFVVADDPVIQVGRKKGRGKEVPATASKPTYSAPVPPPVKPLNDDEFSLDFNVAHRNNSEHTEFADVASVKKPTALNGEPALVNIDTGETYVLCGDSVVIGRGRGSDISFSDVTVSRRHAVLKKYADGWGIEDAGSKCGTTLNGKPLNIVQLLFDGDTVGISEYKLRFYSDYKQGR